MRSLGRRVDHALHSSRQDPLAPHPRRSGAGARLKLDGDAVDRSPAWLPGGLGIALAGDRRIPSLSADRLLRLVVRLRRLRAGGVLARRRGGRLGRPSVGGGGGRTVDIGGQGQGAGLYLRFGPLGESRRGPERGPDRRGRRGAGATGRRLPASRRGRARAVLCADQVRQGRWSCRPHAPDLGGIDDHPRHQGRELDAYGRLPRQAWSSVAVRSDQPGLVGLQPAAGSPTGRLRSSRRAEHRRHPG